MEKSFNVKKTKRKEIINQTNCPKCFSMKFITVINCYNNNDNNNDVHFIIPMAIFTLNLAVLFFINYYLTSL